MADIRGVRLRKFKLRKIILGVRMHFRHTCCIFVLPTHINIISEHERLQSSHGNKHYDWNRADYDYFEYCLQSVDWQSLLCLHPCAFISTLRCFIGECVPHKDRVCVRGKRKCKPSEVRRCDLKKRKLWRKLTIDPHDSVTSKIPRML